MYYPLFKNEIRVKKEWEDYVTHVSSSQMIDLMFSLFYFSFLFSFHFIFYLLFLEQLGLELIGHAVTSVTTWWHSHKMGHETWKNLVEDSRTNNVIQYEHHMLAS